MLNFVIKMDSLMTFYRVQLLRINIRSVKRYEKETHEWILMKPWITAYDALLGWLQVKKFIVFEVNCVITKVTVRARVRSLCQRLLFLRVHVYRWRWRAAASSSTSTATTTRSWLNNSVSINRNPGRRSTLRSARIPLTRDLQLRTRRDHPHRRCQNEVRTHCL